MKKLLIALVAVIALGTVNHVTAGGACCPKKTGGEMSVETLKTELGLTDDQAAKVAALKAECDKTGCKKTSKEKYCAGMEEILTPEQLEKCKTLCVEKGWKCPTGKDGAEKSADEAAPAEAEADKS